METAQTSTFCYNNHPIRVTRHEGKLWFVAADICHALGLNVYNGQPNAYALTRGLGNEAQMLAYAISGIKSRSGCGLIFVTQHGLDGIITRSQKVQADDLRDWVNNTVLPAMRPSLEINIQSQLTDDEIILKAITILQNRLKQATGEPIGEQSTIITLTPPKVSKPQSQWLTVNEWCKKNKINIEYGERFNLGRKTAVICKREGIDYKKKSAQYRKAKGYICKTGVKIYPEHAIREAAGILGIQTNGVDTLNELNAYLEAAE